MDVNRVFKEIALKRNAIAKEQEELKELENKVKAYMKANDLVELLGDEHRAMYQMITSNRFDSSAFQKDHGDLYEAYKKTSTSMRFNFS